MKQVRNTSSDSVRQCHQRVYAWEDGAFFPTKKKKIGLLQEPVKVVSTDSLFVIEVAIQAFRTSLTAHLEYLAHVDLLPCLLDVL